MIPSIFTLGPRHKIVFCATGISHTHGGIASANRNVLLALQDVARTERLSLDVLVLHENQEEAIPVQGTDFRYRVFGGRKLSFVFAMLRRILCCRLLVVDHVQLARLVNVVPRTLLPPVVIFAHGSESWRRIRPSSMQLFRRASRVLTNSHYTLQRMKKAFEGFDGRACPLGLPPQSNLQTSLPMPVEGPISVLSADGTLCRLGERVLMLVGRMDPGEREKGHRELIQVMARLRAEFPDVQLLFVGPGDDHATLRDLAREQGVGDAVLMVGAVSDEILERFYQRSYALVMPSRQEGFGLVYLEAMNWAKPCLACLDDGGGEVVVDGETGFLVHQPLDLDEIYGVLERLLRDPVGARRLGEAGWVRLHKHYTAPLYQERLKAEFQAVLR